jgi:hypothetical protein
VLAHAIEGILAGRTEPTTDPAARGPSVGAVFDAAHAAGLRVVTLTSATAARDVQVSADARVRLEAALEDGHVVVIPERSVMIGGMERSGWWRIDPLRGSVVDEMDDGRGSDASQRSALASTMSEAAPPVRRLGTCVAAVLFAAANYYLGVVGGIALAAAGGGGFASAMGGVAAAAGGAGAATGGYLISISCG